MDLAKTAVAFLIAASSFAAHASGPQPPSHAQHSYSFTCPSGASGHLSYDEDSPDKRPTQLSMWVNGQYIQANPKVAAALQGKTIYQLRGGCEGEKTTVLLQVSSSGATETSWVTVLVSSSGEVTWVGV